MKYSILFCMICVVLSGCSTSQSVNRNPSSEIGNAELDEFHEFDSDSESVFSKLASNAWSQKFDTVGVQLLYGIDKNGKLIAAESKKYPFGFEKKLKFSLSKQTKKTLFGKHEYYFFGMIGGTWAGIDSRSPSHGGGYAEELPVKKMGVKKDGQTYQFLFWSRQDYFVDEEAKRMHTDILHPALSEAKDTLQLENMLKDEPFCSEILKSSFTSYINCAINRVVFDYVILEYSLEAPNSLIVIGKSFDSNLEVFRIKMKKLNK